MFFNLLLFALAAELGEHAFGRFGVEESDAQTLGTFAGSLVDEANLFALGLGQSLCYVLNGVSDVVDTLAAFLDETCDGTLGASGLQKFNFGLANFEESGLNLLVSNLLYIVACLIRKHFSCFFRILFFQLTFCLLH